MELKSAVIKIAHETPMALWDDVQKRTDYDYALCHLLEKHSGYREAFKEAKVKGREIILDNSIYELGDAVDWNWLDKWVQQLMPTWVILPDVLDNRIETCHNARAYMENIGVPDGVKTIGVVQGHNYEEWVECYRYLTKWVEVDMIAFTFQAVWWLEKGDGIPMSKEERAHHMMTQRILTLNRLEQDKVIDPRRKHHLLGCALPQEFLFQRRPWVYSLDTSNPVLWGLEWGEYPSNGALYKPQNKMHTLIDLEITRPQQQCVLQNIGKFRRWCND